MSEEEIEDLLTVSCCRDHDKICEKAHNYILKLEQQNQQLKELYRKTYEHLFSIGNYDLALYFQALIDECPTFTIQGGD